MLTLCALQMLVLLLLLLLLLYQLPNIITTVLIYKQKLLRYTHYVPERPVHTIYTHFHNHSLRYLIQIHKMARHFVHYLASVTNSFVNFFGCTLYFVPCGKCSALRVRRIRREQYCLVQQHKFCNVQTNITHRKALVLKV